MKKKDLKYHAVSYIKNTESPFDCFSEMPNWLQVFIEKNHFKFQNDHLYLIDDENINRTKYEFKVGDMICYFPDEDKIRFGFDAIIHIMNSKKNE